MGQEKAGTLTSPRAFSVFVKRQPAKMFTSFKRGTDAQMSEIDFVFCGYSRQIQRLAVRPALIASVCVKSHTCDRDVVA